MKKKWHLFKFFAFRKRGKIFFYPPVINAEKLVGTCSHVDVIRLALRSFLVHEGVNRVING